MSSNVRNRILSSLRAELLGKLLQTASAGGLVVILARILDPTEYGLLYLAISIFAIATLAGSLGFSRSAARYVTQYRAGDTTQIPHIIETFAIYMTVGLSLVATGIILFREQIAAIAGGPGIEPLLVLGTGYVVGSAVLNACRHICQATDRVEWASKILIVEAAVKPVIALTLALAGYGAMGALVGYVLGSFAACTLGLSRIYQIYNIYEKGPIEDNLRRRIFEYAFPLALTKNADVVIKRVDIVLIGAFLTPLAVAHYTVAKQLITFLRVPAGSLGFSLSARYSEQVEKGNLEIASQMYEEAFCKNFMLYLPAAAGLAILAEPTLGIVFGPDYVEGAIVLQILMIYLLAQVIAYITGGGLDYLGHAKKRGYIKGGVAAANFVLNLALIPTFGVAGAAFSTSLTFAIYVLATLWIMHLELAIDWQRIGRELGKSVAVTLVMTAIVIPLSWSVTGLVTLLVVVIIGAGVWFVLALMAGLFSMEEIRTITTV